MYRLIHVALLYAALGAVQLAWGACRGRAPLNGITLIWHAPVASANGFGNEAVEYIMALKDVIAARNSHYRRSEKARVTRICWVQHGDRPALTPGTWFYNDTEALLRMELEEDDDLVMGANAVSICHSTPPAWELPTGAAFDPVNPCPVIQDSLQLIGRAMFESSSVPVSWLPKLEPLDQIWLPTPFHEESFARSFPSLAGRFRVVPESIRVGVWSSHLLRTFPRRFADYFFDADLFEKLRPDLRAAGAPPELLEGLETTLRIAEYNRGSEELLPVDDPALVREYRTRCKHLLLAVFKWEHRKGIDVLLRAFVEEFADGRACLILKVPDLPSDTESLLSQSSLVHELVRRYVCPLWKGHGETTLYNDHCLRRASRRSTSLGIWVLDVVLPPELMVLLYRTVDCLVAPSRGEGWGRPVMEAMAVGVPVIATNWSGTATLLSPYAGRPVALPLNYTPGVDSRDGSVWAEPSLSHLRHLMRWVVDNPNASQEVGEQAQKKVADLYDATKVAAEMLRLLES